MPWDGSCPYSCADKRTPKGQTTSYAPFATQRRIQQLVRTVRMERCRMLLKCLLMLHEWRLMTNDEGQQYKICDRCGAYRDFTPAAGAS